MTKKYLFQIVSLVSLLALFFSGVTPSKTAQAQTVKPKTEITATDNKDNAATTFEVLDSAVQETQIVEPGGVLHIRTKQFEETNYQSKLGQTQTVIISNKGFDDVYAGVDIDTIPGEYLLTIETNKKQLISYPFIVPVPIGINFSEKFITSSLLKKSEVNKKFIWSNVAPKLPLIFPTKGQWSETFGHYYETPVLTKKQRKSSKQARNLQRIDDISIDIEKPISIHAPSDAVCFLITHSEAAGYTVLLDHGMGLFSEISGLSNLTISEQDRVVKNALIASFNIDDFKDTNNKPISRKINWRVFLNKAVVNPHKLTVL